MGFSNRQKMLMNSMVGIANVMGKWPKDKTPNGAYYISAAMNGAKDKGAMCANCVFWQGDNSCSIVEGNIEPGGACKLGIIGEERLVAMPIVTLRGMTRF